jgi:hypothetical protein
MGQFLIFIYVGIVVTLILSAIRYRGQGYKSGILFAILMLTMPAWVWALWLLFKWASS